MRAWEEYLARRLGRPVKVILGRARRHPVVLEDDGRTLCVRLHRLFEEAPADVRDDVVRWVAVGQRDPDACARLNEWTAARLAAWPRPRPPLRPQGRVHDLRPLRASLLSDELRRDFEERAPPAVTWGRRVRSRARHSLRLGSYDEGIELVRIHPVLDRREVPPWFVRFVLFHEMLHAALPGACHGAAFRAREHAHPDCARAHSWQRARLKRLLRWAREPATRPYT